MTGPVPIAAVRDELVAQTLVRTFLMIMLDKRSYRRPEVPFAE